MIRRIPRQSEADQNLLVSNFKEVCINLICGVENILYEQINNVGGDIKVNDLNMVSDDIIGMLIDVDQTVFTTLYGDIVKLFYSGDNKEGPEVVRGPDGSFTFVDKKKDSNHEESPEKKINDLAIESKINVICMLEFISQVVLRIHLKLDRTKFDISSKDTYAASVQLTIVELSNVINLPEIIKTYFIDGHACDRCDKPDFVVKPLPENVEFFNLRTNHILEDNDDSDESAEDYSSDEDEDCQEEDSDEKETETNA